VGTGEGDRLRKARLRGVKSRLRVSFQGIKYAVSKIGLELRVGVGVGEY
jgi:hypothetical protein